MASPTDPTALSSANDAPGVPEPKFESTRPSLISIHGAKLGKRWPIPAGGLVIGRDPAHASLALPDPSISSRHCAIELEPVSGEFHVTDLASRNGTYVNGDKIGERALCDGDKIFVGETVLKFSLHVSIDASLQSAIDRRTTVDALTGLAVKREFDLELVHVFAQSAAYGEPLTLLMMHIDGLKAHDGDKAHKTGSLCIAEVGRIIREEVAVAGRACRFGGDSFIAFLHPLELPAGARLAERIRARVEAYEFVRDGERVHPTISIGVAQLSADLLTPDHLLQAADEVLFRAKRDGRNRVER
jgi:two-component system cell cycle response regulator